jgi:hypothetical protein
MRVWRAGWMIQLNFFHSHYSLYDIERVKSVISDQDREELFGYPKDPKWIDLQSVMHFLESADRVLGKSDLGVIRECMRFKARREFGGLYKVLLGLTSPESIIRRGFQAWKHMYDQGETNVELNDKNMVLIRITKLIDQPDHHLESIVFYCEEVLRIAGAQQITIQVLKSYQSGDDQILLQFRWTR